MRDSVFYQQHVQLRTKLLNLWKNLSSLSHLIDTKVQQKIRNVTRTWHTILEAQPTEKSNYKWMALNETVSLWGLVWSIDKFATFSRAERCVIASFQLFTVISHLNQSMIANKTTDFVKGYFFLKKWFSLISCLNYFRIICDYVSSLEMIQRQLL